MLQSCASLLGPGRGLKFVPRGDSAVRDDAMGVGMLSGDAIRILDAAKGPANALELGVVLDAAGALERDVGTVRRATLRLVRFYCCMMWLLTASRRCGTCRVWRRWRVSRGCCATPSRPCWTLARCRSRPCSLACGRLRRCVTMRCMPRRWSCHFSTATTTLHGGCG
jgi:hypothetical protein